MIWKDISNLNQIKSSMSTLRLNKLKKRSPPSLSVKPKKKVDRFDGLTEEDLQSCKLPDILKENLDMVFVGINPSLTAAYSGRYYAGPGNHFYKLLYESKLTPRLINHEEDSKLLQYGIGLTNIVERPSRSSSDLKKSEIKEGAKKVKEKLILFQPKIAIFNGKGIYEVFSNLNSKSNFSFGLQPVRIGKTAIWVVPSSSARCAHFPRMMDKLHFYLALRKYLLHLNGKISDVDESEFLFEGKCRIFVPTTSIMWRRKGASAFMHGGRVANKETLFNSSETSLPDSNDTQDPVEKLTIENTTHETVKSEYSSVDGSDKNEGEDLNKEEPDDSSYEDKDLCLDSKEENRSEDKNNRIENKRLDLLKSIKTEQKPVIDFVDLIKQRLSQRDNSNQDEPTLDAGKESSNVSQSLAQNICVKKLKYSMLKKNRCNSLFGITKNQLESSDTVTLD